MPTPPPAPARADAQRNRQRLIEVAQRAFTTGDTKVPLEAVAKEAGVGIGTLYRHFPTRESLVEAVYLAERNRLCDAADELLADHPPHQALRLWMDHFADYIATKREMADALRALIADGTVTRSQAREQLGTAVRRILDAGAADGTLRPDVDAEDVVVALVGCSRSARCPTSESRQDGCSIY